LAEQKMQSLREKSALFKHPKAELKRMVSDLPEGLHSIVPLAELLVGVFLRLK
jgi:hypothetical protein